VIQHIIVTIASELIEYGEIRLANALTDDQQAIELLIFCTGLQLTTDEQHTLFHQNGRDMYRKRLKEQNGSVTFSRQPGTGATVHIRLPISPRMTSL
jgi:chemotaxis protein histidine kinase CheA